MPHRDLRHGMAWRRRRSEPFAEVDLTLGDLWIG